MNAKFRFRLLLLVVNGAVHLAQWWIERLMLRTRYIFHGETGWKLKRGAERIF